MVTNIVKGLLKNYKEKAEEHETQLKTKIDKLTTDVDKLMMENEIREKTVWNKNNRELQKEVRKSVT